MDQMEYYYFYLKQDKRHIIKLIKNEFLKQMHMIDIGIYTKAYSCEAK